MAAWALRWCVFQTCTCVSLSSRRLVFGRRVAQHGGALHALHVLLEQRVHCHLCCISFLLSRIER